MVGLRIKGVDDFMANLVVNNMTIYWYGAIIIGLPIHNELSYHARDIQLKAF